jgi:hypothetical protein
MMCDRIQTQLQAELGSDFIEVFRDFRNKKARVGKQLQLMVHITRPRPINTSVFGSFEDKLAAISSE